MADPVIEPATITPAPAVVPDKVAAEVPAPAAVVAEPVADIPADTVADPKPDAKPGPPDKYELKLPEGSQLQAAHIEKIQTLAKERGLSNDDAQAMLERDSVLITEFQRDQVTKLKEQSAAWKEEFKADKEFGGEKAAENAELAHRVLKRFASQEFMQNLDDSGVGDHPELVKTFARIGKEMSEDRLRMPNSPGGGGQKKTMEERLYPNDV